MRKKSLLYLLMSGMFVVATLPIYGQAGQPIGVQANQPIRVQLMSQQELADAAGMLGKMVFLEDKIQILDVQGNVIAETEISEQLSIAVDEENAQVTITSADGQKTVVEVEMGIEELRLNGVPAGAPIRVYSMNGTLLQQVVAEEGMTTLPMSQFSSGTYIVVVNHTAIKILKP
ncbi:MAG: T9SS type A sorting domain-containing protein [Paludibacteraceae bacterium]|nr:T9SS type A sorting domain-containing protein [Paludibacteraceae bacterium]